MPKIRRIPELPPLPSELHARVDHLYTLAEQLQREITQVRDHYARMNPEHITTDHFGEPITAEQARTQILARLDRAQTGITGAYYGLGSAEVPAARLMTNAAGGRWRDRITAKHAHAGSARQQPTPRPSIERSR